MVTLRVTLVANFPVCAESAYMRALRDHVVGLFSLVPTPRGPPGEGGVWGRG